MTFVSSLTCTSTTLEDFIPEDLNRSEETTDSPPGNRTVEIELTPLEADGPENERDNDVECERDLDGNIHRHQLKRGPGKPRIIRTGQRKRPRLQYQQIPPKKAGK